MRAINRKREGLPAIEVAEQQLGKIIDFACTKSNIGKNLKTALLRLLESMDDAKQDHESKGYEVYPDGGLHIRRKPKRYGGCNCF